MKSSAELIAYIDARQAEMRRVLAEQRRRTAAAERSDRLAAVLTLVCGSAAAVVFGWMAGALLTGACGH